MLREDIEAQHRTLVMLDFDGTLFTKGTPTQFREDVIQWLVKLKKQDPNIQFCGFTRTGLRNIVDGIYNRNAKTKQDMVDYLESLGIHLEFIATDLDAKMERGLGAFYREVYEPTATRMLEEFEGLERDYHGTLNDEDQAKVGTHPAYLAARDREKEISMSKRESVQQSGQTKEALANYFIDQLDSQGLRPRKLIYLEDDEPNIKSVEKVAGERGIPMVPVHVNDRNMQATLQVLNDVLTSHLKEIKKSLPTFFEPKDEKGKLLEKIKKRMNKISSQKKQEYRTEKLNVLQATKEYINGNKTIEELKGVIENNPQYDRATFASGTKGLVEAAIKLQGDRLGDAVSLKKKK